MTHIIYTRTDEKHELILSGHAGFDVTGKDIVCSAISAVCYSLLGYIENYASESSEYYTASGSVTVTADRSPELDAVFDLTLIGLQQIQKQYPRYIGFHV